ncbi:hypothetical protein CC117_24395 [Parafrankia colletiae]|uniref:Transposase, Mutator family n=1 Tax=Parafrankia colletiae TaxID=573497 RepID=A0A1S1QHZ3_9ACTN|nr:hypothetical protein [Parafrankia colletiae]MCK9901676.1 hypothetical protein [Frankia sp. Cpl3]OHV32692.1 hypothetical protein CC117_24395 [Parafrankia colletiae]
MSLLASLLREFGDDDRDHMLTLIRTSIAEDLDAVAGGAAPARQVDVGTRSRRTRATTALA